MKTVPFTPSQRFIHWIGSLFLALLSVAPALDPPPASLLATDTDADGQPDVAEYFTGTNPNLRTDVVKLDSVRRLTGPDRIELSWPSISGRAYSVQKATALGTWTQVMTTTANSTRTTLTVLVTPGPEKSAFFRITTAYNEATQPFIVSLTADKPSPLTTAGLVRFTLKAYHPNGLAGVDIRDSAITLGQAVARGANEWAFDWQADERNNGIHNISAVMISANGVTRTSNTLVMTVNVTAPRQHFTICETLEISANTVSTVNTTRTFSGNVQIGPFTMTGNTTVTMNLSTQIITGTGPLYGPGGVLITSLPWTLDAARCLLSLTGSIPAPWPLIPGYLTLTTTGYQLLNYASATPVPGASAAGVGTLSGVFAGRRPVSAVNATGSWISVFDRGALTFSCTQTATFGSGISTDAGGTILLQGVSYYGGSQPLSALMPMVIRGRLHFPGGTGGAAADVDGFMEVKLPVTTLDPSLPPLVQGAYAGNGLPVIGSVDADGSFRPLPVPPQPQYLLDTLANWVPLGPDCRPIEGVRVFADALGNLPPCAWRPMGSCGKGGTGTVSILFPNGLRMIKPAAETFLEFLHMKLDAGPDCPIQFRQQYEIHAQTTLSLSLNTVTVAEILGVLSINASLGLDIRLHHRFDAKLKGGTFSPKGLAGAVLDMAGGLLDLLPDPGAGFPDFVLEFECPEFIDVPCQWPASLPASGGGGVPVFFGGGGRPECRVRIPRSGDLCVFGRSKVTFGSLPGAPSFAAEITGCLDRLCFEVTAEDTDMSFAQSWTLPGAETLDISVPATAAALDPLARTLFAKACAFERHAASMLERAQEFLTDTPPPPRDYKGVFIREGKALLDAFGNAKIAVPSLTNPAALAATVGQAGRNARSAPAFDGVVEVWITLEQLNFAGVSLANLNAARAEVWDEMDDRLNTGVEINLTTARRMVEFHATRAQQLVQAGRAEDDAGLATRTGRVIDTAVSLMANHAGATVGSVVLSFHPRVRAKQLEETWQELTALRNIAVAAAARAIPVQSSSRLVELRSLLAQHAQSLLTRALNSAVLVADPAFYERMMARYVKLAKWAAAGEVSNVVMDLTLPLVVSAQLVASDFAPSGVPGVAAVRAESERAGYLIDTIRNLPGGLTLNSSFLGAFHARFTLKIDGLWPQLNTLSRADLLALLEAGVRHARLRDLLGLGDGTAGWETAQRLSALMDRLNTMAGGISTRDMLETLKQAAMLLFEEADRFALVPNHIKRRFCLVEAEKLVFKLRDFAIAWFGNVSVPVQTFNWGAGLSIKDVAAGFCYDVTARTFSGWASGSLQAQGFAGPYLNLKRAVFSSSGSASLEVETNALPGFPPFPGLVTLTGTVSAGGGWSLTSTATGSLPRPSGLAWVVPVQNNAQLSLSNNLATIAVNQTTGLTQATGTVSVSYSSGSAAASFTGHLYVDPSSLTTGIISVVPVAPAAKLDITISGGATGTISSSRCSLGAPFNVAGNLPALTITDAGYSFSTAGITSPVSAVVNGYAWQTFQWSVQRVGGALSLLNPSFVLSAVPGFDPATITFPANAGNTISSNGTFAFNFASVLPEIKKGLITLNGSSSMAFPAISNSSGLTLSLGTVGMVEVCRIPAPPAPFAPVPYLNLSIPASAAADAVFTTFNCRPVLQGFAFGDSTLRLERVGGVTRLAFVAGNLAVPGGGPALTAFNGTVSSTGAVNLSQNSSAAIFGFPVTGSTAFTMTRAAGGEAQSLAGDGAEAVWKLDETAFGAVVKDSTGNGHDGTVSAQPAVYAQPARPGSSGSYTFDGVDDGVSIPDSDALEGGSSMSVEAWFKVNAFTANWQAIVTKGDDAWRIARDGVTNQVSFDTNSAAGFHVLACTTNVNDGKWHHVAGTYDGTTKRIFIDGVQEAFSAWAGPVNGNTYPVMIGENAGATGRRWSGNIDEVAFFRRALTAAEISAHWGGGRPEGWWKLDEQLLFGTLSATDSANARHGLATSSSIPGIGYVTGLSSEYGFCYRFDGVDDSVTIADNDNLEGGTAMTAAAWIRVNAFDKAYQAIVTKGDNTWRIARAGSTTQISFDTNGTAGAQSTIATTSVNDGRWHHVCATWDGAIKRLYIDGVQEASAAWSGTLNTNALPVMIGENAGATGRHWNGWLDEVLYYRRALTAAQVQELAQVGTMALNFNATLNLHSTFQAGVSGSMSSLGSFDAAVSTSASQAIAGPAFNTLALRFAHQGSDTRVFGSASLAPLPVWPGAPATLGGSPKFTVNLTRSGANTQAALTASGVTLPFAGYNPQSPGFSLSLIGNLGTSQVINFSGFRFGPFGSSEITDIGFPSLSGVINPQDGAMAAATLTGQVLNLRNQLASNVTVNFGNTGLQLNAPFAIATTLGGTKRTWGNVSFSGNITPGGSYNLAGSGALTFGTRSTDNFAMRLKSPDYGTWSVAPDTGVTPNLNFGALDVPLTTLGFHADGYNLAGQKSGSRDWAVRTPLPVEDYLFWVLDFSFDFNGNTIRGGVNAATDWKWKGIYPNLSRGPERVVKLNGSVNSDGILTIDAGRIVSGTWPVDLGIFGGINGWNIFPFDGGAGNSFPRAPSRASLW